MTPKWCDVKLWMIVPWTDGIVTKYKILVDNAQRAEKDTKTFATRVKRHQTSQPGRGVS